MSNIGNFENIGVAFGNWGLTTAEPFVVNILEQNVFVRLTPSLSTQIQNNISISNGVVNINDNGIYMIQYVNSFSGGVNDQFMIRFTQGWGLGADPTYYIPNSLVKFTTKGTNFWEVQNMIFVNLQPKINSLAELVEGQEFPSSNHTIAMEVANRQDTSNIKIHSSSLIVTKLL